MPSLCLVLCKVNEETKSQLQPEGAYTHTHTLTSYHLNRTLLYVAAVCAVTKRHRLHGLNRRNFIFSQFWRFEVQDQVQAALFSTAALSLLRLLPSLLCPHVTFPLYPRRHRYSSVCSGQLYFEAYLSCRSITRP